MNKNDRSPSIDVAIIGAGLSGLNAAVHLQRSGKNIKVFEAAATPGGRVSTENFDGFLLDKGFQILLTAYPHAKMELDYPSLDLRNLVSGALIWKKGRFRRVINPFSSFAAIPDSLRAGLMSFSDLMKIIPIYTSLRFSSGRKMLQEHTQTAEKVIAGMGLSKDLTESFLKPFFRGILLDHTLQCPGNLVKYVLKMFIEGPAALPAKGMQAIPNHLAEQLHAGTIQYNSRVKSIDPHLITLDNGEVIAAREIVVACDQWSQAELLHLPKPLPGREVYCCYFAADRSPFREGILVLNGENEGIINSLTVLSDVAPNYAPPGASLISATVVPDYSKKAPASMEEAVRAHLMSWFGPTVKEWQFLKTVRVQNAQPSIYPMPLADPENPYRLKHGIWQCGDFIETPSIESALRTGRGVAEAILHLA